MGFNMFNKTLEILKKKSRCMLRKNKFFAITAAIMDLENGYYFLNISVITQIEFMNIEMYILVQQIYILSSGAFSSKTSDSGIVLYARHSTFLNCHLTEHLNLWKG